MILEKAEKIAEEIRGILMPFCEPNRCVIAGSIRRRCSIVHDIDMVCIPSNPGQFAYALQSLGKVKMAGQKIIRVGMGFTRHIDLDVYIATPETWATLLLIRTGSTAHNVRLCMRAKNLGMKLHADGSGLFKIAPNQTPYDALEDVRIAGDTEESIFKALELPYLPPERRS
jgi:DNA polymerase (family 10)